LDKVFGKVNHIHFVGIGGIGMSGIAEVLHTMGFTVSGSDLLEGANVKRLQAMGITVFTGHRYENAEGADVVVYSSAVKETNPELVCARDNFVPVIKRGEMLAELMRLKYSVAISGSHGKTTTTSMVAEILNHAKLDPTVVVGGILNTKDTNATLGSGDMIVAEADESDRSFLLMSPSVALVTNIDFEHPDTYKDLDDVKQTFVDFVSRVPFYGSVVLCMEDDNTADLIPKIDRRFITYGFRAQADVHAVNVEQKGFAMQFDVVIRGEKAGRIKLGFPGEHNVLNALGAIAVALEFDIPFKTIKKALEKFEGVQRRLTTRYADDSCIVMDDYGHHPTEIKTTLKAVRGAYQDKKVLAIFQPHRFTRTAALMKEFATAFFDADMLFITDIYAASEDKIEGVDSETLVREIKRRGFKNVQHVPSFDGVFDYLNEHGCDDTVMITLGAGSITKFSHELAEAVKEKRSEK
jgi:UDP-N-acetylmuramate--alanine ligase